MQTFKFSRIEMRINQGTQMDYISSQLNVLNFFDLFIYPVVFTLKSMQNVFLLLVSPFLSLLGPSFPEIL